MFTSGPCVYALTFLPCLAIHHEGCVLPPSTSPSGEPLATLSASSSHPQLSGSSHRVSGGSLWLPKIAAKTPENPTPLENQQKFLLLCDLSSESLSYVRSEEHSLLFCLSGSGTTGNTEGQVDQMVEPGFHMALFFF